MNIGLIGYGYWGGGFVARNIARVANLKVVADPDPEKLNQASQAWGAWGTRTSSEPRSAIEECDAVWIATPVPTHYDLTKQALQAGKHVLCEKPFVTSLPEAVELTELAEQMGVALMVGHLSLFMEQHWLARDLIERQPTPQSLSYRRHTDRTSLADISVLWGLGPHDVASAVDLFGPIREGRAVGNVHRVLLDLMLERGKVTIDLDWLCTERSRWLRIDGRPVVANDEVEPLLREALAFRRLCENPESAWRARSRMLAREVTSVLDGAEVYLSVGPSTLSLRQLTGGYMSPVEVREMESLEPA